MTLNTPNPLTQALARNELALFLAGDAPYFFDAKNDNEEPQNIIQAFDALVLPYWQSTHDPAFPAAFSAALIDLLDQYPDKPRALYVVQNWIWIYHFALNKQRSQPLGRYGDLFTLELSAVAPCLKILLTQYKQELIADNRWAGAAWNSSQGLWEPMLRTATVVRDQLDGPDFVPDIA